jgi:NitT/TauT family transport system permease protein
MQTNVPHTEPTKTHDAEIAGIDALEIPIEPHPSLASRTWRATWPVAAAVALFLLLWQVVVWLEIKPSYALPGPLDVFKDMWADRSALLTSALATMRRAAVGYAAAFVIGIVIGLAVVGSRTLRTAVGSLITGLQTMPSIAWFPMTILLLGLNEQAILAVIILGAAPAVANGLIGAVDHIPPILLSAGRVLGAKRWSKYRHVVIPASLPTFVGGMKQGWAFAWRSLMAGELIVRISPLGIGQRMKDLADVNDNIGVFGSMIAILLIGIIVDRLVFTRLDNTIRAHWGLAQTA